MATHDELDAIEQIKKLKARYFRCMDAKDWDGFQAVFADDASMDTTQEAPNIEVVIGAPQIRQFVEGSVGPVITVHHGHMPEIEITSPTTANGIWAMQDFLKMPEGSPLGRNGRPEEIAALIAYLLGPDARFFCGSVLFCDGGMDAQFRSDDWPKPWRP